MSNQLAVPAAARGAMAAGWATFFLDDGPGDPQLLVYTSDRPADGASVVEVPGVTIVLAKPSGIIVGNRWRLQMKDAGGYQAVLTGAPKWGRMISASGLWAGDGDAGGPSDDVLFKLSAGAMYIGGYILIGTVEIG